MNPRAAKAQHSSSTSSGTAVATPRITAGFVGGATSGGTTTLELPLPAPALLLLVALGRAPPGAIPALPDTDDVPLAEAKAEEVALELALAATVEVEVDVRVDVLLAVALCVCVSEGVPVAVGVPLLVAPKDGDTDREPVEVPLAVPE